MGTDDVASPDFDEVSAQAVAAGNPRALFFELHRGLPRESQGSDASTERALALAQIAPRDVLDVGCGPGAQTLVLARSTGANVIAADVHQPFLDELTRRAAHAGLAARISTVCAPMQTLPFANASFDLIWSEGAIYLMGFEAGLRAWRPLLRASGVLVVSELTWLVDDPPAAARDFWHNAYPALTTRATNRAAIERSGYELLGDFDLPYAAWFTEYYDPLESRIDVLEKRYGRQPAALAELAAAREEIALARRFGDTYGYVFYAMRKLGP